MSQPAVKANPDSGDTTLDLQPAGSPPPAPLTPRVFGMTDKGRVRPDNEDHFLTATLTKALQVQQTSLRQQKTQYADERGHLFVVADGMGGHRGGEEASALALDTLEHFILNAFKWFSHLHDGEGGTILAEFQNALRQTDTRLFEEAQRHPSLDGMGTTLTMAFSLDRDLFLVHVGDSRFYLFRQDRLHQITKDHTYVQELLSHGHLSAQEAKEHHLRHVITNVVGGTEPGVRPEIHKLALQAGDVLLLCSDGLTEMLPDEDIAALLRKEGAPQVACQQLVHAANERGGKDNITVIVARYDTLDA